jgi:hypothetical protein
MHHPSSVLDDAKRGCLASSPKWAARATLFRIRRKGDYHQIDSARRRQLGAAFRGRGERSQRAQAHHTGRKAIASLTQAPFPKTQAIATLEEPSQEPRLPRIRQSRFVFRAFWLERGHSWHDSWRRRQKTGLEASFWGICEACGRGVKASEPLTKLGFLGRELGRRLRWPPCACEWLQDRSEWR